MYARLSAGTLKALLFAVGAVWLGVASLSLWWNIGVDKVNHEKLTVEIARAYANQIMSAREWNSTHYGVYVFADEKTPPNPYLDEKERDILLPDGRMLTKVNPAYMTRQLSVLSEKSSGYHFRMTSLNPINPANSPDEWERAALNRLAGGESEVREWVPGGNGRDFVLMTPLKNTADCLECHAKTGEKIGEIRGGLSVTLHSPPEIRTGPLVYWHIVISLLGVIFIFSMGRGLINAYEERTNEAEVDQLTRIANRRHFVERLGMELRVAHRTGQELSLVMIDVDHFKLYNDNYGHVAGDKCLVAVAGAINASLKRPSDLAARFGGEEFVALLPDTGVDGALHIAERIRVNVENLGIRHEYTTVAGVVTVSLGVAAVKGGEVGPGSDIKLENDADKALYRAKNGGRNRVEA